MPDLAPAKSPPMKTDNHNPAAKLALRRHFLRTWHAAQPPDVLDAFAGYARLWTQLRKEFPVASYTGLELRKIPGRLHMDSLDYLRRRDWSHDILDLDAYGSPWKHLLAALPHISQPTSIFLTIGNAGLGSQDSDLIKAAGIPFAIPIGLHKGLASYFTSVGLALPLRHGLQIVQALEAPNPGGTCRYIGLHLRPPEFPATGSATATSAAAAGPGNRRPSRAGSPTSPESSSR